MNKRFKPLCYPKFTLNENYMSLMNIENIEVMGPKIYTRTTNWSQFEGRRNES